MSLKEIVEKAEDYDAIMESFKNQPIQVYKDENKHFKGYMFDSLVYRYKLAREQAMQYELMIAKRNGDSKESTIIHTARRDIMRFIEILDEAIGEHD